MQKQPSSSYRTIKRALGGLVLVALSFSTLATAASGRPNVQLGQKPFTPDMLQNIDAARQKEIRKAYDWAVSNGRVKFFTVAVGPRKSWATLADGNMTRPDRILNVLQRCEHYEKTPCALIAADGLVSSNTRIQPSTISYDKKFSVPNIPFIPETQRKVIQSSYPTMTGNRAIAINSYGYYGMAGNAASTEEAAAKATQQCENSSQEKCFIYSINDDVLFTHKTSIVDQGF